MYIKICLTAVFAIVFFTASSQNKNSLFFGVSARNEHHSFTVEEGPSSTRGEHEDQNWNYKFSIGYSRRLFKKFSADFGAGIGQRESKIRRIYERSYFNDYTALLFFTYEVRYNLVTPFAGFNYTIESKHNHSLSAGTVFNFNIAMDEKYRRVAGGFDKRSAGYFFGFENELNIRYKKTFSKKLFFCLSPAVTTLERWRKDPVLFEDASACHNLNFNAFRFSGEIGFTL